MKRLAELCQPSAPPPAAPARRGIAGRSFSQRGLPRQRLERQRERLLRGNLLDFHFWTAQQGLTLPQTASHLHLAPRTLRQWLLDLRADNLRVQALGRPPLRASRQDRNAVLEVLSELGPATGVPTLQTCFPALARAELTELLQRFRRVWQRRHGQFLYELRWPTPGAVWAMDFTEAPQPIDGLYPYLLAVRDLASGQQLLWLPLLHADAAATLPALLPLFTQHGAPLVLKTDNGSPFCAGATLEFLHEWGVIPLFSPPHTPRYNGSIEAGIGSLKTRTQQYATQNGRPTSWSWHDAAAAQTQANATARPRGANGATAEELWNDRPKITQAQRASFQASVDHQRDQGRLCEGWPAIGPLRTRDARALDRQAIRRVLVEHDLLLFRRRLIPLPFTTPKTADIR